MAIEPPTRPEGAARRGRPVGDRDAKRHELLAAGITVIAREGYAGASLRKVAQQAGYTTGAVTYYFANKEALVRAITEHMFDGFDAMLHADVGAADVKSSFKLWIEQTSKDTELWLVLFQLLAHARHDPACAEVFQRRYAGYRRVLAWLLEYGQHDGSIRTDVPAELLADLMSSVGDGWIMMMPVEPERFAPERVDALLDALLKLLAPPAAAAIPPVASAPAADAAGDPQPGPGAAADSA